MSGVKVGVTRPRRELPCLGHPFVFRYRLASPHARLRSAKAAEFSGSHQSPNRGSSPLPWQFMTEPIRQRAMAGRDAQGPQPEASARGPVESRPCRQRRRPRHACGSSSQRPSSRSANAAKRRKLSLARHSLDRRVGTWDPMPGIVSAGTGDSPGLSLVSLLSHSHFAELVGQAGEQHAAVPFQCDPGPDCLSPSSQRGYPSAVGHVAWRIHCWRGWFFPHRRGAQRRPRHSTLERVSLPLTGPPCPCFAPSSFRRWSRGSQRAPPSPWLSTSAQCR